MTDITDLVDYAVVDHIAIITILRPEAMNAVNARVAAGLGGALERADRDLGGRAVVVTGAGRAFCAGADLKALAAGECLSDPDHPEWGFAGFVRHPVSVPVIAAINGFALGASTLARSEEASQTSASVICRTERVQVDEHVGFAGSGSYADATDSR
jgi:enoyl-CoA hydratase/carnithine racemase